MPQTTCALLIRRCACAALALSLCSFGVAVVMIHGARGTSVREKEHTSLGLSPSKRLYSRVMWRRRGTRQASVKLIVLLTIALS